MTITTINVYDGRILTLPGHDVIPWNIDKTDNMGIFCYSGSKSSQTAFKVESIRSGGDNWTNRHDYQKT